MKLIKASIADQGNVSRETIEVVANHAINMLTDTAVNHGMGQFRNPPNAGFNTIVTKNIEYSMQFNRVHVCCVGIIMSNATIKALERRINEIVVFHFARDELYKRCSYVSGSRGWAAASPAPTERSDYVIVDNAPYRSKDIVGYAFKDDMGDACLSSIILDLGDVYQLPNGYEHPEYPFIGDLKCAKNICPIPLLYNVHSGFLQEIFYYLVCHQNTHPSIMRRLKALVEYEEECGRCSSYCMNRCRCRKVSGMHIGHRPIFPRGTQLPSVLADTSAAYKRSGVQVTDAARSTPDITYQTVAKGTSIAANAFRDVRRDIHYKKWGSFAVLKIPAHSDWKTALIAADADAIQQTTNDTFNMCGISGQPLYDDCYYVCVGPVGILVSVFVMHHTSFIFMLSKTCDAYNVYRTCVPQTFNDLCDTYMADEHPLYAKILRAAHYGAVHEESDRLVVKHGDESYTIKIRGYVDGDDHAVLCS